MSAESIRAAAEREAAEAEAEEPKPEGEPEPEPAPEPEPEPTPEPEAVVQAVDPKALEKVLRAHEKAVSRVMGVAAVDLHVCDTCGGVGYTPEGYEPEPEVLHDPDTVACTACNGYGQRLTGARAPASPTRPCTVCAGSGYETRQVTVAAPTYAPAPGNGETGYVVPQPTTAIDPVAVEQLRRAGYTVIDPIVPASAPPA